MKLGAKYIQINKNIEKVREELEELTKAGIFNVNIEDKNKFIDCSRQGPALQVELFSIDNKEYNRSPKELHSGFNTGIEPFSTNKTSK
ncbi:MAG: hypothetical protein LBU88_05915 [Treponema sp.]|jgi:hypothetical protein|nr:hypothetical protein [Treponema sp.]